MYDPMVAKLIVWDTTRELATKRMLRALDEYEIGNLKTLIPFHKAILATEQWANAETCRDLIEDKTWLKQLAFDAPPKPAEDGAGGDSLVEQDYTVEVSGKRFEVRVFGPPGGRAGYGAAAPAGAAPAGRAAPRRGERKGGAGGAAGDDLASPLQGNVWKVPVKEGDTVEEGQIITIIEAMKMENEITAHKAGTITKLAIKEGEAVTAGALLAVIKSDA
jgi:acetyl-CoA/propionyl-CoA carboxylase biotin carboxyl carrier protein